MKKLIYILLPILLLTFFTQRLNAQCSYTVSATPSPSTCQSNGSVTVSVSNISGTMQNFQYGLETQGNPSGFSIAPNPSNVLNNVPPGTYQVTVRAFCIASQVDVVKTITNVVVGGNYQVPIAAFSADNSLNSYTFCNTGVIALDVTRGSGSFAFKIVQAPSGVLTPQVVSTTKNGNIYTLSGNNYPAGNYVIEVSDACYTSSATFTLDAISTYPTIDQSYSAFRPVTTGNTNCNLVNWRTMYSSYITGGDFKKYFDKGMYEIGLAVGASPSTASIVWQTWIASYTQTFNMSPYTYADMYASGHLHVYIRVKGCTNSTYYYHYASNAKQPTYHAEQTRTFSCTTYAYNFYPWTDYDGMWCTPLSYVVRNSSGTIVWQRSNQDFSSQSVTGLLYGETYTMTTVDAKGTTITSTIYESKPRLFSFYADHRCTNYDFLYAFSLCQNLDVVIKDPNNFTVHSTTVTNSNYITVANLQYGVEYTLTATNNTVTPAFSYTTKIKRTKATDFTVSTYASYSTCQEHYGYLQIYNNTTSTPGYDEYLSTNYYDYPYYSRWTAGTEITVTGPTGYTSQTYTISSTSPHDQYYYLNLGYTTMPPGNYTITINDKCGSPIVIPYTHTGFYDGSELDYTYTDDCNGRTIRPTGHLKYGGVGTTTYYRLTSGPEGYDKTAVIPYGGSIVLTKGGTYKIGILYENNSSACAYREKTIVYDPQPLQLNELKTAAYVCNGETIGHIFVSAKNGKAPYTYELWNAAGTTRLMAAPTGMMPDGRAHFQYGNANITYMVKVTDACGNSFNQNVYVIDLSTARVVYAPSNGQVCEGSPIQLNCVTLGETTYSWVGPGFTSNVQNPLIPVSTVAMSGRYTVTVQAEFCGTPVSDYIDVTVNPAPAPTVTTTNLTYWQNYTAPSLVAASGATAASGFTLKWYAADGTTVITPPNPISTTTQGVTNYYVSQVNDVTGCESVKIPVSIIIIGTQAGQYTACPNTTVVLGVQAQTGVEFRWYATATGGTATGPTNTYTATNITPPYTIWVEPRVTATSTTYARIALNVTLSQSCGGDPTGCASTGTILFKEDFGGNQPTPTDPRVGGTSYALPTGTTDYVQQTVNNNAVNGAYWLLKYNNGAPTAWQKFFSDHTYPNDNTKGYMFMVDADTNPGLFYKSTINNLCPGTKLYFSTWLVNMVMQGESQKDDPSLRFDLEDSGGNILATYYTGKIPRDPNGNSGASATVPNVLAKWRQYGTSFTMPAGQTSVTLKIYNNTLGSSGNDLAMDDIEVRLCVPPVTITAPTTASTATICENSAVVLNGTYSDDGSLGNSLWYRWEKSTTGNINVASDWSIVGTAQSITNPINNNAPLSIASFTSANVGYYRLVVANSQAGLSQVNCRAVSSPIYLSMRPTATAALITANGTTICSGTATTLTASAAGVTNPVFKWYNAASGGTLLQTGASYTPSPSLTATTIFYVSVSGDNYCENPDGSRQSVTVTVKPNASPTLITANGTTICSGTATTLTASATGVTNPVFKWYSAASGGTLLQTGASYTPSPNLTATTTFYVSVSGDNYCENLGGNRQSVTVTVNPYATAALITANGTTICSGTATTLTASAIGVTNPVFKWYSAASGGTLLQTGASYTPSPNLTATTTFYVSVSGDNYCENLGGNRQSVTVTVNPYATTALITANGTTICSGTATTLTASATGVTNPVFKWYSAASGGTLLQTGASYTPSPNLTATTTFYVSVTGDNYCENQNNNRKTVTVTVNPYATAALITANGTTICNGTATTLTASAASVTNPIFKWYSAASGGTLLQTGASYTPSPNLTATTTFYVSVSGDNYCENQGGSRQSVTVTVYDVLSAGTISTDQNICYNTAPAQLTGTAASGGTGLTYQWQSSTTSASTGFTNISGETGLNINPGSLTQPTWFRRVVTSASACGTATSNVVYINVYGQLSAGTISADQNICYNTAPAQLTGTAASGGTGLTYQWQSSTTSASTGFTNISGETGLNINPGSLTQPTWFRRVVTSASACGSANSNVVYINVYGQLSAGTISADQNICYNTAPAQLTGTAASGGTGLTYQWQSSTTSASTGFTNISGETGLNINPGSLTQPTWFRRVVTSTGTCGSANSNVVYINVYGQLTAGTISADQNICYNTAPAQLTGTAASGGTGLTYQWQSSTTSASTGFTNISGETGLNINPGSLTQPTWFRRVVTSTGTCGSANSNVVYINVYGQLTAGTISADQNICYNTAPAQLTGTAASGGTGLTYQWQSSTTSASTGFTNISGETGLNINPSSLTQPTWFRRVVTSGSACGSANSNVVYINVYGQLTAGTISADQNICYNTAPAQLTGTAASGGTGLTYQWQSSTTSASTGFTNISGETGLNISPGSLTQPTWFRRVVTSTGTCGSANSNVVYINVYGQLTAGTISADQNICYNTAPAQLTGTAASGGTGLTYQWQSSTTSASTGFTNIVGETGLNITPGNLTQPTWFRRVVTSASACGTATSNVVYVNVYGQLSAGTISTDQNICYNTAPAQLTGTAASGGTGLTYQWQSSTTSASTGFTNISGETGLNISPGSLTQPTWFRRVVTSTGTCGSANSNVVYINVYGQLTAGTISADQNICYNTAPAQLTGTAASGGTGLTYQWQSSTTSASTGFTNISGETGLNINPGSLTQPTWFRRVVTSASACGTATSNVVYINVYPNISYPDIRTQVCPDPSYTVDLTSYLTQEGLSGITWSTTTGVTITGGSKFNTGSLIPGMIYPFQFTANVQGNCKTPTGTVYVKALTNDGIIQNTTIVRICKDDAERIQLKQILGIDINGGTWTFNGLTAPYIITATNGAITFNGKVAWNDNKGTLVGSDREFTFTYTVPAGSCSTTTKTYTIKVILTPTL